MKHSEVLAKEVGVTHSRVMYAVRHLIREELILEPEYWHGCIVDRHPVPHYMLDGEECQVVVEYIKDRDNEAK